MAAVSTFTDHNLDGQGFGYLDQEAKAAYALPLRFTPAVCAILIAVGLARQSSVWLGAMALVGLSGVLFPRGMVTDRLYDVAVRRLLRAPPLPPTPVPRQFSYFLSTSLLTRSALSFQYERPVLGFVLGGAVLIGATILATTLWCLGSWISRRLFGARSALVRQVGRGGRDGGGRRGPPPLQSSPPRAELDPRVAARASGGAGDGSR